MVTLLEILNAYDDGILSSEKVLSWLSGVSRKKSIAHELLLEDFLIAKNELAIDKELLGKISTLLEQYTDQTLVSVDMTEINADVTAFKEDIADTTRLATPVEDVTVVSAAKLGVSPRVKAVEKILEKESVLKQEGILKQESVLKKEEPIKETKKDKKIENSQIDNTVFPQDKTLLESNDSSSDKVDLTIVDPTKTLHSVNNSKDITQIARPVSVPTARTDSSLRKKDGSLTKRTSDITDKTIFNPAQKKSANTKLIVGAVIKNRFILEECIGHGGMGTVYKARDLRKEEMHDDASYVAIKFLNDELRDQPEALISLQREAKKSQALAHPNIVTVYDFDRDGDLVYLSMEYLDGKTLDELISSGYFNRLPVEKVMSLIEHVARALAYAHQQGFAHADLKPSNIFLTADGHVKVLDFGIAQAVRLTNDQRDDQDSQFDAYTLGAITPNFASPEMLDDKPPIPSDDIYSLGCVAYGLLTGKHPFLDDNGHKLTAKKAQERNAEAKVIPQLSRRHMQAMRRCLYFDGEQRFQNAGEFIDAIKPPVKLRRWVMVALVTLSITVLISWWITVDQSNVVVGLNDLPDAMSELVDTIKLGDSSFDLGDIDQAHKLYAQAWESSYELADINPRDQVKLKVIIDRRIDSVINFLIKESGAENLDEFRLLQLQIALEFLQQGEVGTLDKKIDKTLAVIAEKINALDNN
ncbi:MAG: serine/threonine protein kinase [Cellvibrionaceae bacterium]